jgi:hypothetical protein
MRRKLFTILSAVSLVLCVATVVLWRESYRAYAYLSFCTSNKSEFHVAHDSGRIGGYSVRYPKEADNPSLPRRYRQAQHFGRVTNWVGLQWGRDGWKWAGFDVEYARPQYQMEFPNRRRQIGLRYGVRIPYWFLVLATLALPTALLRRKWFLRHDQGSDERDPCRFCAYDLRATPDRCPECGRAATTKGTMPAA